MKGAALTVPEARAVLIADDALQLSYMARLASGQAFSIKEREAWAQLVESATDWIAAFESTRKNRSRTRAARRSTSRDQTLAVEASAAANASAAPETEAQALRTGIETLLRTFGAPSAGWTKQFRALLERVPATAVDGETAR